MTYRPGDHWLICDRCSEKRRRSTAVKEWTGLMVCTECCDPKPYEMTPPNIYAEGLPVADPRPDPGELPENDISGTVTL